MDLVDKQPSFLGKPLNFGQDMKKKGKRKILVARQGNKEVWA